MRGHIHKREHKGKNGKTVRWYVVVDVGRDEAGRRQQKWHGGFKTRREAEQALTELVRSVEQQTYVAPKRMTLTEFVRTEWLPTMRTQVKASTWDSYQRNLEHHVLPTLGGRVMQQITAGHLNALYRTLLAEGSRTREGGLSAKTVRYIHTTISKILGDAVDLGMVARNVAATARPPKLRAAGPHQIRFWTPEELSAFLHSVRDDHLYALWHLAAMTGMRRGELLGLRWQDIDERGQRLSVRQTVISVAYEIQISTPKTHTARVVDLDPGTLKVLSTHRRTQQVERAAVGDTYEDHDLVFCKDDGRPLHPDILRQTWEWRVKKSKLRRIRFHDLRHTHATIGLRAGVPVKVMSERLGHSTPAFTLQQYAHVIPGMQAEAAGAIADLVWPVPDEDAPVTEIDDPDDDANDA